MHHSHAEITERSTLRNSPFLASELLDSYPPLSLHSVQSCYPVIRSGLSFEVLTAIYVPEPCKQVQKQPVNTRAIALPHISISFVVRRAPGLTVAVLYTLHVAFYYNLSYGRVKVWDCGYV